LPAECRIMARIRRYANASPITAHTIDRGTPAFRIVRPNKMLMGRARERSGL
jgi:hypothetical protein